MTEFGLGSEEQEQKQIPCGNDRKKCKGNDNSRFPKGMTERKARTKAVPYGNDNRKSES
jgi:hypothetical protein